MARTKWSVVIRIYKIQMHVPNYYTVYATYCDNCCKGRGEFSFDTFIFYSGLYINGLELVFVMHESIVKAIIKYLMPVGMW